MNRLLLILLVIVSSKSFSFKANDSSKIKSVNIQFEGFDTETFFSINCDRFDRVFKDTKKVKLLTSKKDLKRIEYLSHCFAKERDQEIDVRGKITISYEGHQATYCFDTFGLFSKDGVVYYNKDLLILISDKIYGYHPEELN